MFAGRPLAIKTLRPLLLDPERRGAGDETPRAVYVPNTGADGKSEILKPGSDLMTDFILFYGAIKVLIIAPLRAIRL